MMNKTAKYAVMIGALGMLDKAREINRCHECGAKVKNSVREPYSRHRIKPRGWPNPICDQVGKVRP